MHEQPAAQQDYPLSNVHIQTSYFVFEPKFFVFRFHFISFFFFLSSPKPSLAMSWSLFIFLFFQFVFSPALFDWVMCDWCRLFSVSNDCEDRVGWTRFVWCSFSACRGRRGKRKRVKLVRNRMDGRCMYRKSLPKLIGNIYVTNYLWCEDPHKRRQHRHRHQIWSTWDPCIARYACPENWDENKSEWSR